MESQSTKSYIKVGVVGSRRRNTQKDKEIIRRALSHRIKQGDSLYLVSGGCEEGADKFAEELSAELKLPISIHYPDKSKLPDKPLYYQIVQMYYDRNILIAEECDLLIALPADDRRGGTEHTIRRAEALGKPVILL